MDILQHNQGKMEDVMLSSTWFNDTFHSVLDSYKKYMLKSFSTDTKQLIKGRLHYHKERFVNNGNRFPLATSVLRHFLVAISDKWTSWIWKQPNIGCSERRLIGHSIYRRNFQRKSCATCREKCPRAAPRTAKSHKPAHWTPCISHRHSFQENVDWWWKRW
jgi:hypothetical protein